MAFYLQIIQLLYIHSSSRDLGRDKWFYQLYQHQGGQHENKDKNNNVNQQNDELRLVEAL